MIEQLIALAIGAGAIYLLALLVERGVEWVTKRMLAGDLEKLLKAGMAAP